MATQNLPVYCIPGLGTDRRVFRRIATRLEIPMRRFDWPLPESRRESLEHYAARFNEQLPKSPVILMGYSFGGIVGMEMLRQREGDRLILLSSLTDGRQVPPYIRATQWIPYHELSTGNWRAEMMSFWAPILGMNDVWDLGLMRSMFRDADDRFRLWGIDRLARWMGTVPDHVPNWRIHGDRDRILPLQGGADVIIRNAGHLVLHQQADVVVEAIRRAPFWPGD